AIRNKMLGCVALMKQRTSRMLAAFVTGVCRADISPATSKYIGPLYVALAAVTTNGHNRGGGRRKPAHACSAQADAATTVPWLPGRGLWAGRSAICIAGEQQCASPAHCPGDNGKPLHGRDESIL